MIFQDLEGSNRRPELVPAAGPITQKISIFISSFELYRWILLAGSIQVIAKVFVHTIRSLYK